MTDADRSFLKAWIAEAGSLGLAWWERLALILFFAFMLTAGKRILAVLPTPTDPGPAPRMPDVTPDDATRPDAEWGDNVRPNDTPDAGGGA